MPRNTDSLFLLQQQEGENLKDFVYHFNSATLEISNLNEHVAMPALQKGLKSSRFTFFLDTRFLQSYTELLAIAQKYAAAEE